MIQFQWPEADPNSGLYSGHADDPLSKWLTGFWNWLSKPASDGQVASGDAHYEWSGRGMQRVSGPGMTGGGTSTSPATSAARPPATTAPPTQQSVSGQMQFLSSIGVPKWQQAALVGASQQWGVPVEILAALEKQESGFDTGARSKAGALGAFQFMPGTARSYGLEPSRFNDPNYFAFQAQAAAQFLASNFAEYQNWEEALLAYNVGPDKNAVAQAEEGGNPYAHDIYNIIQGAMPSGAMANVLTPQASASNPNPKSQMFWAGAGTTASDTAAQQAAANAFVSPDGKVLFQGTSDYDYYQMVDGPWQQIFGRHATWSVVQSFKAQGIDNVYKLQNAINSLPSQVPGWSIGKYDTVKQLVDKQSEKLTGRPVPDTLLKEFAQQGIDNQDSIQLWFLSHGASDVPKDDYQQLWDVANKFTQGTWNQVPDPRQIYAAWKAAGGTPNSVGPPTAGTGLDLLPSQQQQQAPLTPVATDRLAPGAERALERAP